MSALRHEQREIVPGITVQLRDAGHLLGSACLEFALAEGEKRCKLDVRGGSREPILIALSRLRERAGERDKCRISFERARPYRIHVPRLILVLYRVQSALALQ